MFQLRLSPLRYSLSRHRYPGNGENLDFQLPSLFTVLGLSQHISSDGTLSPHWKIVFRVGWIPVDRPPFTPFFVKWVRQEDGRVEDDGEGNRHGRTFDLPSSHSTTSGTSSRAVPVPVVPLPTFSPRPPVYL